MKNFLFTAVFIGLGFTTIAQEAKTFRLGIDGGAALVQSGGGAIFSIEPKYNFNDKVNIGLRFETAGMVKEFTTSSVSKGKFAVNFSTLGTIDTYFSSGGSFVPYIGAGLGLFFLANTDFNSNSTISSASIASSTKLGGLIRLGFEVSRFRTALEYNIIPSSSWDTTIGSSPVGNVKNSYLGLKVGLFIGSTKWGRS